MPMYVYHAAGHPVGFLSGSIIHDMSGEALGRVLGSHVYRFDGSYVGEWFKETVVAKPTATSRRPIQPIAPPARVSPPAPGCSRRGVIDYGYADVFHYLHPTAPANNDLFAHAAE